MSSRELKEAVLGSHSLYFLLKQMQIGENPPQLNG